MKILICWECNTRTVDPEVIDRIVECPSCGHPVHVDELEDVEE